MAGFSVDETQDPAYFNLINQMMQPGGKVGWTFDESNQKLNQYGTDFYQQFQNAVGRPPTQDEVNNYFSSAVSPVMSTSAGFGGTDPNAVAQSYIPQAFQSDIQQNQQNQMGNLANQISSLGTQVGQNTASALADPTNPMYQAFSGSMNNLGISPSSGAFQSGIGSTIGNAISQSESQGLNNLGMGAIAGNQSPNFQSLLGTGQQAASGMNSYNQQIDDFMMQSQLAQQLAGMAQPSTAQKDIGMAAGASQALGGIGTGMAGGAQLTSYICKALIAHGLAAETDLDLLHQKTIPAIWQKARAFWLYATHAKELVAIAEAKKMDWRPWRKWFLDDPMDAATSIEAVNEYIAAYKALCLYLGATHLWDKRALNVGFWDSLPFLPKVLTYKPFIKAAWKVWKMNHMILLDLPLTRLP